MSHKYELRIEVTGIKADETDRTLDEIIPKWWNGDCGRTLGRTNDVVWVEGKDRLVGGESPEGFRDRLEERLESIFGRRLRVVVSGTDLEGEECGVEFCFEAVHLMGAGGPAPCGDSFASRRWAPTRDEVTCKKCLEAEGGQEGVDVARKSEGKQKSAKKPEKKAATKESGRRKSESKVVTKNLATGESMVFGGHDGTVHFSLGEDTIYAEITEQLAGGPRLRLHVGMFRNVRIIPVGPGEILIEAVSEKKGERNGG